MEYPKFSPAQDGRVKITPDNYSEIKQQYKELLSLRAVARLWGVDRHTIKAIIDPEWYKNKQAKRYAKKPWLEWNERVRGEEWNSIMRKHRAKKQELQAKELREYHHSKRGKIFDKIPCLFCGEMFLPKRTAQKYCSRKHYLKNYKRNNNKLKN